ncbi:MAG: MBL fold metallo-hydrolase [Metallosphaera sp.]
MRVTFLGTGAGSTIGSRRFKSGILIEGKEAKIVLDFGSGVHMRLEDLNVYPDAIFITHLHVDHFSGIFDHLVRRKIDSSPVVSIYSPHGLADIINSYKRTNEIDAKVKEDKLPGASVGDLEIYSVESCHKIYAVSYVITDGNKRILYSGDTAEPCDQIMKELNGIDMIIHEASCIDDCKVWGHTSVKEAVKLFRSPVLTHIPSQIEHEIQRLSNGLIAKDGMTINV